jgi:hypothetical protein
MAMVMPGSPFRIDALLTSECLAREHGAETGDDRGGIAVGAGGVYYTGDTRTARFDLEMLLPLPTLPAVQRFDGIIGASSSPSLLTLASGRVPMTEMTSILDAVLQVNADLSVGAQVPLGSTVFVDRAMSRGTHGIFTNDTAVMLVFGSRAVMFMRNSSRPMEFMVAPLAQHQQCESWAIWGALENIDGVPWVSYVRDPQTIVRQNTMTGEVRAVSRFVNLADMCSFAIDPARARWYFHHEGTSQFRAGDETIGRCAATFLR